MRRRRQKNPLLMRILGISILLHLLLLPVLAHYGAFKKIQQQFVEARMVVMPAPEQEKPKAEVKKEPKTAKKTAPVAKKSAATTPHQHQAAQKSNLNQPKVVASAGSGAGSDDGPTVDANGTGKAGELPTQKTDTTPPTVKQEATMPPVVVKKPDLPKTDTPKIVKNETPEPKVVSSPEIKPEIKNAPVYSEVQAIDTPQPTIPDDLRAEALHATFVAEFVVGVDGKPSSVKAAQSTGNDELDRLALETARKWRFKPATRDGQPIESRVRLHIEFQVTE